MAAPAAVAAPDAALVAAPVAAAVCYDSSVPSNIEIKAKLRDREAVETLVRSRADHGPELIIQKDVFRLRIGAPQIAGVFRRWGELIFYRRLDTEGPAHRISSRRRPPIRTLGHCLKAAFGAVGMVRKRRTLYLVGQTRIHLDEVDGLGDWLELEVVLEPR